MMRSQVDETQTEADAVTAAGLHAPFGSQRQAAAGQFHGQFETIADHQYRRVLRGAAGAVHGDVGDLETERGLVETRGSGRQLCASRDRTAYRKRVVEGKKVSVSGDIV